MEGQSNIKLQKIWLTYIADAFLTDEEPDSTFNDIYDWVTNIYGEEWGDHSYPTELIGDYDEINIVLADLMDDNLDSGVAGYFWAKDNYTKRRQIPVTCYRYFQRKDLLLYRS